jgi:purine-binding chemotaxis protein CheW
VNGARAHSWEDLARAAARGVRDEPAHTGERQLLVFHAADAAYAVPVECVREIVRVRPITPIPRVGGDVRGVISLRGEIVQVIDLRRRLGLAPIEPTRGSRIVVLDRDGGAAGLLVDGVREVLRVRGEAIAPPSAGETDAVEALCVSGREFVSLLELDRVFRADVES